MDPVVMVVPGAGWFRNYLCTLSQAMCLHVATYFLIRAAVWRQRRLGETLLFGERKNKHMLAYQIIYYNYIHCQAVDGL
jgi:hypothetical protein